MNIIIKNKVLAWTSQACSTFNLFKAHIKLRSRRGIIWPEQKLVLHLQTPTNFKNNIEQTESDTQNININIHP